MALAHLTAFEAGSIAFLTTFQCVAPPDGIEPPTLGFGDRRSTG